MSASTVTLDIAAQFGVNVDETSLDKLQKLQNRAAITVTGCRYDESALPIIRALGWPTVRELRDLETLKMVFKSLNGEAPSYMSDMFTRVSETTSLERLKRYNKSQPNLRKFKEDLINSSIA